MVLRMKDLNEKRKKKFVGFTEKFDFFFWGGGGGGSQKTNIEWGDYLKRGGLGQFADLRGEGGLARERGWCF